MMNIDWKNVAKPQPDGYDSLVAGNLLFDKYGWRKTPANTELTLCAGTVAVRPDPFADNVPADHYFQDGSAHANAEWCQAMTPYLETWQAGATWLGLFLDEFWPKFGVKMHPQAMGSISGHYDLIESTRPGKMNGFVRTAVYVSVNHKQGCAEGIYHEAGHVKLKALGIDMETHDGRLIANRDDELYDSSVRYDVKRPMSAVMQAIYSWLCLTENDLQLASFDPICSKQFLIQNLPKIEDGLLEIRKNVRYTSEGKDFLDGFFEWGDDIVSRAHVVGRELHGTEFDAKYAAAKNYRPQPV